MASPLMEILTPRCTSPSQAMLAAEAIEAKLIAPVQIEVVALRTEVRQLRQQVAALQTEMAEVANAAAGRTA